MSTNFVPGFEDNRPPKSRQSRFVEKGKYVNKFWEVVEEAPKQVDAAKVPALEDELKKKQQPGT